MAAPLGDRANTDRAVPSSWWASTMRRSRSDTGWTADDMGTLRGGSDRSVCPSPGHPTGYPAAVGSTLLRRFLPGVSRACPVTGPPSGVRAATHTETRAAEEQMTTSSDNHFVAQ